MIYFQRIYKRVLIFYPGITNSFRLLWSIRCLFQSRTRNGKSLIPVCSSKNAVSIIMQFTIYIDVCDLHFILRGIFIFFIYSSKGYIELGFTWLYTGIRLLFIGYIGNDFSCTNDITPKIIKLIYKGHKVCCRHHNNRLIQITINKKIINYIHKIQNISSKVLQRINAPLQKSFQLT